MDATRIIATPTRLSEDRPVRGTLRDGPRPAGREREDHSWDPAGETSSPMSALRRRMGGMVFMGVIALPFNVLLFKEGGGDLAVITVLVDLMFAATVPSVLKRLAQARKFGVSRLEYAHFPYRVGEPVELCWRAPVGMGQVRSAQFTLRCVRQTFETEKPAEPFNGPSWQRPADNQEQRVQMVHMALWQGIVEFPQAMRLDPAQPLALRYEPPAELPGTWLNSKKVVFWELDVRIDAGEVNFQAFYLVPVY